MNSHQWRTHASKAILTVKAKSEPGLFEESVHALFDFIKPIRSNSVAPIVNLDLKGKDMGHLLTELLSNTIKWTNLHKAHYHTFVIHEVSHHHLIGVLEGHIADSFGQILKSTSLKDAHIEHKDGWMTVSIEFNI